MSLQLEEPSVILQQLEQLHIANNDSFVHDVENDVRGCEVEIEITHEKDHNLALEDGNSNTFSEKRWDDCYSEDGIQSTITNNNDKDVSSVDGSDISLPKHRKYYKCDDERTDSDSFSNEDEPISEDTSFHLTSPQRITSSSNAYPSYEQITPIKFSNARLQVNEMNVPLDVSPMSLGNVSSQDDIDVARIVNPIVRSIADLKSEFHAQLAKLHYYMEPNINAMNVNDDQQHTEFENSQDQCRYDAVVTAGKLLDVIIPLQLPEEAKKCLIQARNIIWEKSLLYRVSSPSTQAAYDADPAIIDSLSEGVKTVPELTFSGTTMNNSSEINGLSVHGVNNRECYNQFPTNADEQFSTSVDDVSNNESDATNSLGKKQSYRPTRDVSAYPSPNSGRRNQSYVRPSTIEASTSIKKSSPRAHHARSARTVASVSGSASNIQANNRRFVGFLPSRCFTCGGIGHFANNCASKGSYITTSTIKGQQPYRRRRSNGTNHRRPTKSMVTDAASNE
ncbi:7552_t:CDS:1 [Funneliformis geosporum]|uniref:19069_t:CDS:1 n=1 Tax=Funneliformis geosporum TaxID=1117311 RepID=A0A9W4SHK8_9GLOM|nr:7552_t:CDS:1 [Funneliformis geosporum]CAI2169736.1 19069_t:CDS:1 [Funneliformis geosporum]